MRPKRGTRSDLDPMYHAAPLHLIRNTKKKQIVIRAIARRSYTCITGCRLVATHLNGWLTSMVNGHKNYGSSHKALAHNGAVSS